VTTKEQLERNNACKKRYKQTPEGKASRKNQQLKKYNTNLTYNAMWFSQNGCCGGCGKHATEFSKALGVDHDHITGQVRGLLCENCNKALGFVKDNPETLQRLLEYLK